MNTQTLVKKWFQKWEEGNYHNLPISNDFIHTSPYGTIKGKETYINLIHANKDKFLGHHFELHDSIYGSSNACVRYTAIKDNFRLEVSEWYYTSDNQIDKIVAYYNIEGEISEERKLSNLDL